METQELHELITSSEPEILRKGINQLAKVCDSMRDEIIAHRRVRDQYLGTIGQIHDSLSIGDIEGAKQLARIGKLK